MDLKLVLFVLVLARLSRSFPVSSEEEDYQEDESKLQWDEFEKKLETFLDWYYDNYHHHRKNHHKKYDDEGHHHRKHLSYGDDEGMQSDQPQQSQQPHLDQLSPLYVNLSSIMNIMRSSEENNSLNDQKFKEAMRNRTKETWKMMIRDNVLRQMGRVNTSMPKNDELLQITALNFTQFMPTFPIPNESMVDEDFIAEKIRSYYPSCEIPRNTDQEAWKDENDMNLYFNVEQGPEENGVSIATATLRLYRLPQENVTALENADTSCENTSSGEDDKLLRISIYWYTKSLKKHRVKRRLSDTKVIGENAKWVELSVRPATRAWVKGRNLGLAVQVEDQDGTVLKADRYFKGASCTVGTSTPKPIPTVIVDATSRWQNGLEGGNGSPGGNSTAALHNNLPLLPTIDICTLEFPENYTQSQSSLSSLRINACDLKKAHDQTQKLLERERWEKFAALTGFVPSPSNSRHIRHHRQHPFPDLDLRSRVVNPRIIMTQEELRQRLLQNSTNR